MARPLGDLTRYLRGRSAHRAWTGQSAPLPFGFLSRRIAEHERKKVEEYNH